MFTDDPIYNASIINMLSDRTQSVTDKPKILTSEEKRKIYQAQWNKDNAEKCRAYNKKQYDENTEYRQNKHRVDAYKRYLKGVNVSKFWCDDLIKHGYENIVCRRKE
jgi:uncharacterized SAM-binding protein YcdF (DUF218 family)